MKPFIIIIIIYFSIIFANFFVNLPGYILLKKNHYIKKVPFGFSFPTLFFGFFVPLLRKDLKNALVMLIINTCTLSLSWFIFPFFYNKSYIKNLLSEDFISADKYSKEVLIKMELYDIDD